MASPQAGWYPDPSGDISKLRYWDGVQWTDNFMDAPQAVAPQATPQEAAYQTQPAVQTQPPQPGAAQPGAEGVPSGVAGVAGTVTGAAAGAATGGAQPGAAQPGAAQPGFQVDQPIYAQPVYAQVDQPVYAMNKEDQTLRLIAFIFALISTLSVCWAVIPLAWMIPMTVMSYKIYKGTRANTTAFGVCSLIFLSVVTGILLLVSSKEA